MRRGPSGMIDGAAQRSTEDDLPAALLGGITAGRGDSAHGSLAGGSLSANSSLRENSMSSRDLLRSCSMASSYSPDKQDGAPESSLRSYRALSSGGTWTTSQRVAAAAIAIVCSLILFEIRSSRDPSGEKTMIYSLPFQDLQKGRPLADFFLRDDADGIFDGGSVFGHMLVKMECPAAPHLSSLLEELDKPRDDIYRPTTLFPVSKYRKDGPSASRGDASLTLLVGILSACNSTIERQTARDTWMRLEGPQHTTWKAVFLLSSLCEPLVRKEHEKHGDILLLPTPESYYALTPKVLKFMDYAHSLGALYTMKADDDTFVFVDRILMELQHLPQSCLYWGSAAQLPDMDGYANSVIGMPLSKWYIEQSHFSAIAGAQYMAGGAYILSKDLVSKIVWTKEQMDLPDALPEDAVIGRAIGPQLYQRCKCHDSRHIKHITAFQNIQLFDSAIMPCERADISRRTLTIHGFKNTSQMWEVFQYATVPHELECDLEGRDYTANTFHSKYWGRTLPMSATQTDPVEDMRSWVGRLLSPPPSPWETRKAFVPFNSGWVELTNHSADSWADLIPLWHVLSNGLKHPGIDAKPPAVVRREQKDTLPWCLRIKWASQALTMLAQLAEHRLLLCDLRPILFYVEAPTLNLKLHKGRMPYNYGEERFFSSTSCFTNSQCKSCFKMESDAGIKNALCNTLSSKCVGYDGVSQVKVGINNTISMLLPPGWESEPAARLDKGDFDSLQQIVNEIFRFAYRRFRVKEGVDTGAEYAQELAMAMEEVAELPQVQTCLSMQRMQPPDDSQL